MSDEFLIAITDLHSDGGLSSRIWVLDAKTADELADRLGPPLIAQTVSAESAARMVVADTREVVQVVLDAEQGGEAA